MAARTCVPSSTTSCPATRALPEVGGSSVVSMWTVVDLPAPFGPRNPYTSPVATRMSMPSTARGPFLNSRTRSVVSIAAVSLMAGEASRGSFVLPTIEVVDYYAPQGCP